MRPAQPNQSLIDGLACLQVLAAHDTPLGSRELGRMLGLEPTRVNRLLKTLAYVGMAQQDDSRKYLPGPGIHVLAAQSLHGSGLLRRAVGPLNSLLPLGHMVAFGVLWRTRVCYLYFADQRRTAAEIFGSEAAFPASESGLGLALLADHSEAEVRALYENAADAELNGDTPDLDGRNGLLAQVRRARRRGYGLTLGYGTPLVRTVAVTVGDPPVAAIGLSGTLTDDEIPGLVDQLRRTADQISVVDQV
ncbi:IclR family transcriptional regulator [Microlunatus speluncae]|uniref:IclR family transcriptional regulator n=1 Tax=Microlunatus speluncae TaxID=2594267 RepID=UPI0012663E3C|nr:helix-turn-helix domain-containing protein [Microlunatus speluncae]